MQQAQIFKADGTGATGAEELALINRYARRALSAEEVYTFSMVLCDNLVDRDHERFTAQALVELGALFEGRTGIFDHNPKGRDQTARIFKTWVQEDAARTAPGGETYHCLCAKAYMVRSELTAPLILEIDGGIKKEVSVGCAVGAVCCSVCGADMRGKPCSHKKGRSYGGVECFHELSQPTDAYEWSFVAVPAQVGAGVTKGHSGAPAPHPVLKKRVAGGEEEIHLSPEETESLMKLAQAGREYTAALRADIVRLCAIAGLELEPRLLGEIAGRLELQELLSLKKALAKSAHIPAGMQTASHSGRQDSTASSQFKI